MENNKSKAEFSFHLSDEDYQKFKDYIKLFEDHSLKGKLYKFFAKTMMNLRKWMRK